jgi:DNA topoisomerase-3
MRLDEVLVGKADYHAVIDGVATAARELIEALVEKSIGKVELAASAPARRSGGRRRSGQADGAAAAKGAGSAPRRRGSKTQRAPKAKPTETDSNERAGRSKAPTDKMVAYAENIARAKKVKLPDFYRQDFDACRKFLDEHAR